ncbi:MAG: ribosome maturation factor RimM [Primorskyibacter sp.]
MSDKPDLVCVGAIAGAFGVRGDARIKSFCADPAAIADYAPLYDETGKREFSVKLIGKAKGAFTAKLGTVTSREMAEAMKGFRLYAPRERLPALPDDEFYHSDLIGMAVFDTGGGELGEVTSVQNHGASDLLELRVPGQSATVLLPFTLVCVPTVDLTARRIVADPPEGLFE